jgi:DNA-binding transcriptional LysR family regulator
MRRRSEVDVQSVQGMEAFVRAAELRSFAAAAKRLGLTSSGVGKAVSRLEAELGVRLLHRTTRRIGLTDEGAVFLEHCRRVLEEVERARASITKRAVSPRGRVRVSVPPFIGMHVVVPALAAFTSAYPDVSLDVSLSDRRANLAEDGIDVAIRVGEPHDASVVARRLGAIDLVAVAAPTVLARTPIEALGDLPFAPCVALRQPTTGRERSWHFRVDGRLVEWSPRAAIVLDGGDAMVAAAAGGAGVTQVPEWMARDALARGAVVEVLAQLRPPPLAVHVILPGRTRRRAAHARIPGFCRQPPGVEIAEAEGPSSSARLST